MTRDEIVESMKSQGFESGGELYLPPPIALKLIELFRANDVAVLGAEAFVIEDEHVLPLLEHIADCAPSTTQVWKEYVSLANECCRRFLLGLPQLPGVHVALTPLTEDEVMRFRRGSNPSGRST